MSDYLLMNKDQPILAFSLHWNDYGEISAREQAWLSDLRPLGYFDLQSFLEGRRAPKHRAHIPELLRQAGCGDLEGFLRVSHALSLHDTFWVQEAHACLSWEELSLYRNDFNDRICRAAFDGEISSESLSSTSPEFGTDGYYAKCWIRTGPSSRDIYLYKAGSRLYEIEPVSEFLACQVAQVVCKTFVPYELLWHHEKLTCRCGLFTDEHTGFVKMRLVSRQKLSMDQLLAYFESIGAGEDFRRMCILDALIYNPDRHYGNFGVFVDNATQTVQGLAPVFDHNRALFPELDEEELSHPEWYLQRCEPRLGASFLRNAHMLMTESIAKDVAQLQDFHFANSDRCPISPRRLELLDAILHRQVAAILDGR